MLLPALGVHSWISAVATSTTMSWVVFRWVPGEAPERPKSLSRSLAGQLMSHAPRVLEQSRAELASQKGSKSHQRPQTTAGWGKVRGHSLEGTQLSSPLGTSSRKTLTKIHPVGR